MDRGDPSGGSNRLAELIDKYGEVLLPDLKHYYGIDLRDLFSEDHPLSPKFVLAHVHNLPLDSAFSAELRGGQQFRGWDEDRYLSAALTNAVRTLTYVFVLAHIGPNKRKPKPPEPWPLPDKRDKQHKPGSFAAIALARIAATRQRKASANDEPRR